MEHWVPIRKCEYHEEERMPCEICLTLHIDYLIELECEAIREYRMRD